MQDKIQDIIKVQETLLFELTAMTQMLKAYKKRIDEFHILSKSSSFRLLNKIVQHETILYFYKMIQDDHYSITKLNQLINKLYDKNDIEHINNQHKAIRKCYASNKLNEIRNEYIAHILPKRENRRFNWNDIFNLTESITIYFSFVKTLIGDSSIYVGDSDILVEVIDVAQKYQEIQKIKGDHIKGGKNEINLMFLDMVEAWIENEKESTKYDDFLLQSSPPK